MWDSYFYRRAVKRPWYSRFRLRLGLIGLFVLLLAVATGAIIYDLHRSDANQPKPISQAQTTTISSGLSTFYTSYFSFQDSGKWVLDQPDSTGNKFIFYRYNGLDVQYELSVYVNQVPIPLYLATSRVLPIRIVNASSFDVTNVSDPCKKAYPAGALDREMEVAISGATMLCDPDTPQYTVVLSQIGGDYKLNLVRKDGTAIQFVITFRDLRLDPDPERIIQIANTFRAR